ncbi:MAG: citrate/2-methylcitrate synthase [Fuerstiella sp.]|nr:citrate/2-methylcitrate synthase [Fuerstiella sp.]
MEQASPAPHLVNGLHQIVKDLGQTPGTVHSGLSGVVCGETDLFGCRDGRVEYCGIDVRDLCSDGFFESVIWLLVKGIPADPDELADISTILAESAVVDQPVSETIATVPLQTRPLDLFPLSIALLSCFDPTPGDRSLEASRSQFWRVMAQLPVLLHVAFGGRLSEGRVLSSDESKTLSYAGRLLQILRDDNCEPSPVEEQAMNSVMICQCLTEMRPACFSARFFGSAVNDIVAALKAASSMFVSQLRNDPFAWSSSRLNSFRSPDHADHWWQNRQPRVMPFGFHRDGEEDSRVAILQRQSRELLGSLDSIVMESSAARLESLLARDGWFPTVDWAAARTLTLLNVPEDRISLAIGIARMVGWAAQTIEQHTSGVQLLPSLRYAGDATETS